MKVFTRPSFLEVKEVAEMSGFSVAKIYIEIHANRLHSERLGKKYRIQQKEFDRWINTISGASHEKQ